MTISSNYTKVIIAIHNFKDIGRSYVQRLSDFQSVMRSKFDESMHPLDTDYADTLRKKTRLQLVRLSGAVCGIEFCYAAETAFVSPTLLALGLQKSFMTLMWCFSPILGIIFSPILGSLSDNCHSSLGRRRPFIILLSVFILSGLILTPNGKDIGYFFGDSISHKASVNESYLVHGNYSGKGDEFFKEVQGNHKWGIVFTVLGTVFLDFGSDACQSPARTYLLDVTTPEDHTLGLSTFSVMAGLGGSMGYAMGAVNWEETSIGETLGGHVRAVFTFVAILFLILVILTITSFKEIPLNKLHEMEMENMSTKQNELTIISNSSNQVNYGVFDDSIEVNQIPDKCTDPNITESPSMKPLKDRQQPASWKQYLKSIIRMPKTVRWVCLTNLFCWMSLVCYSLYFTDFVGESVFEGNPDSSDEKLRALYEDGVRFGCWGMSVNALSCSIYAYMVEKLIKKFGSKPVYIGGQLVYSFGMILMGFSKSKVAVILLSSTTGVMYATLFTLPYILVAQYHSANDFGEVEKFESDRHEVRGMGTDVAVIGGMAFVAQIILSSCMGAITDLVNSSTATIYAAAILSICGALCATKPIYLDL